MGYTVPMTSEDIDDLRDQLTRLIIQSKQERDWERENGNEYSVAVSEMHHSVVISMAENYIIPLFGALWEERDKNR